MAFAAGLPAFVLIKVFSPGFFAREDTKTPMWFAAIGVVVNILGSLALFPSLTYVGIAVATSLSGWVNAFLLGWTLNRRGHFVFDGKVRRNMPMVLLAAIGMGAGVFLAAWWADPYLADRRILFRAGAMAAICAIGLVLFAAFCQATRVVDFVGVVRKLRRRKA